MVRALVLGLMTVVLAGCMCVPSTGLRIGDSGTGLRIRNDTSARLTVTKVGQNVGGRDFVSELALGAERQSLWQFPTGSSVILRAATEDGRVIFCHRYSYEELRRLDSLVVIIEKLDC